MYMLRYNFYTYNVAATIYNQDDNFYNSDERSFLPILHNQWTN